MRYLVLFVILLPINGEILDDRYHSLDEVYEFLYALDENQELENWVHLDTLGYSTQEGIPILGMRISDNANEKEDEPRVLFIGQVHAEEILGLEIVIDMMKDLLFPDASIYNHMTILKEYLDIWFIPTANPEGLNVVHDELDLSYRKNKTDFSPEGPIPNGIFDYDPSIGNDIDGVDLNRNFGFNWVFGDTFREPDNSDYASHFDYYKGEQPFSEGEAVAIRDLALENDFVFSIVWHSSRSGNLSEKVFTSWKWEEVKESPDLDIMKSIADHFANSIETEDGSSTYLSVYSGSRNGKLHDWFYRETGCIQYLVECGTSNLQPDSMLIENTILRNKPAMVYLMDRAIGYYADAAQITGLIYDSQTGLPIEGAMVEVLEHTGGVLKPRLSNEFGRYRRILDVGTYNFVFSADGYLNQEFSLVANNSGITEQNIYLEPAPIHQLQLNLVHDTDNIETIVGTISNPFYENEITITSGENIIELPQGNYSLKFLMDDLYVPWGKDFNLSSNLEFTIYYHPGLVADLGSPFLQWENIMGQWAISDTTIRTQSSMYYDNVDSTTHILSMTTSLLDVSGSNRAVVKIDHRYETEWDHDYVLVRILNEQNNVLASQKWSGDSWKMFKGDLISATTGTFFDSIKVQLSFITDETVNYRGWEIGSIMLFSISDEYLSSVESVTNTFPQIPMRISGVYPNPSVGRFQISVDHYPGGNALIEVFNLLGQNILTQKYQNTSKGKHFINLDLGLLNGMTTGSGMFFVKIRTQKEQAVKKCIILKN